MSQEILVIVKGMAQVPDSSPALLRQFSQEWPRGPRADGLCSWCSEKIDASTLDDNGVKASYLDHGLCIECQVAMESDLVDDDDEETALEAYCSGGYVVS